MKRGRKVPPAGSLRALLLVLAFWGVGTLSGVGPAHAFTIELDKPPKQAKKVQPKPTGPVILDARGTFDYTMGHHRGALPIRWEDYAQTEDPHRGSLDPDLSLLARKLRVLGIEPTREVIVVGRGKAGRGEEGRIGWMLSYLGVKKVRVAHYDQHPGPKATGEPAAVPSAEIWNPKANEGLRIRKNEMENIVASKAWDKITLIDVRSPEEFKGEKTSGHEKPGHIPGAVNIPWTEFVADDGNPLWPTQLDAVWKKHSIDTSKQLVFYCAGGVRSGYATFVAHQAGLKARHFDGSFKEWAADDKLPVEK